MNDKITLPVLVQLLSNLTGDTRKLSEDFIKELFNIISEELSKGNQVKIKNLGVFKTISVDARKSVSVTTGDANEIPAHRKVSFVPAKEVAQLVNEPFEMFESVILEDDNVSPDTNSEISEIESSENVSKATFESDASGNRIDITDDNVETYSTDSFNSNDASNDIIDSEKCDESDLDVADLKEDEALDDNINFDNSSDVDSSYNLDSVNPNKKQHRFLYGFLSGFGSALILFVLFIIALFYVDWCYLQTKLKGYSTENIDNTSHRGTLTSNDTVSDLGKSSAKELKSENSLKNDPDQLIPTKETHNIASDLDVPTKASDKPVYDTVTTTRYLMTMAKDHYGNYHLWPYIYLENKDILGHPNRIKPGTRVIIPSLSKYGVDPSNPEDIVKAKKMGTEIYSRYE